MEMLFLFVQQKSIAPMVHRQQTVDSLKKFNARRKLKVCCVPLVADIRQCVVLVASLQIR